MAINVGAILSSLFPRTFEGIRFGEIGSPPVVLMSGTNPSKLKSPKGIFERLDRLSSLLENDSGLRVHKDVILLFVDIL
jgi:hypothetical protein